MSKQLRLLEEAMEQDNIIRLLDEAYEQEQLEREIRDYEMEREHKSAMREAAKYNAVEYGYLAS